MDSATDSSRPGASVAAVAPASHATAVDSAIHERLLRDYKRLKVRVDSLEKENEGLRASLWEVSWRWGRGNKTANGKGAEQSAEQPAAPGTGTETPPQRPHEEGTTQDTTPKMTSAPSPAIPSHSSFMRLNEPIKLPTSAPTPTPHPVPPPLPSTPSSLAASLFPAALTASTAPPSSAVATTSTAPSSAASRTTSVAVPPPSSAPAAGPASTAHRDATLKRTLDISLPTARSSPSNRRSRESWRWTRAYDLKAHRGAVYALKFSEGEVGGRGRVLGSAGMDGVRIWGPREGRSDLPTEGRTDGEGEQEEETEGDPWDEGDVEEIAHLTAHTGPVSDLAFSPTMSHLLTGGYDSQLFVTPLSALSSAPSPTPTPTSSTSSTPPPAYAPIWSLATEGLVQSVCWLSPTASASFSSPTTGEGGASDQAAAGGNLFAWGTSGRMLGVGDLRIGGGRAVMEIGCEGMINSVQSFARSPTLLVGDSLGQIRHFSLRAAAFLPFPDLTSSLSNTLPGAGGKKGPPAISCLAVSPDWNARRKGGEGRWLAGVGFDNFIRVYDRSLSALTDPLKMAHSAAPKLVTTLKGKNRNWPIKATWFQGKDYLDAPPPVKRRPTAKTDGNNGAGGNGGSTSRTRSRSASFSSSAHNHSDSDSDDNSRRPRAKKDEEGEEEEGRGGRMRPLERSLLLATGSSDNTVLLWDLSSVSEVVPSSGAGEDGKEPAGSAPTGGPRLLQRLEGHKESVYAVDFLQAAGGEEGFVGVGGGNREAYKGPGLLASAGGDWVVKVYKPQFREEE